MQPTYVLGQVERMQRIVSQSRDLASACFGIPKALELDSEDRGAPSKYRTF